MMKSAQGARLAAAVYCSSILADLITAAHGRLPRACISTSCDRTAKSDRRQLLELFLQRGLAQRLVHVGIDFIDDAFRRFGGATMPYQATASKPGSVSAIVGTFGSAGRRADEATARSFSLPA